MVTFTYLTLSPWNHSALSTMACGDPNFSINECKSSARTYPMRKLLRLVFRLHVLTTKLRRDMSYNSL